MAGAAGITAVELLASALGLSSVMPCLDEARTVGRCVEKAFAYLHRHGILGELIVAENGSTDGLQAIAVPRGRFLINGGFRPY